MTETQNLQIFQQLKEKHDVPLHPSIKELLQEMIDTLQNEYNIVIANPGCTEYDALEYILLFTLEGCIAATKLGSNMEEYYAAADMYAELLGLYGDKNEEALP